VQPRSDRANTESDQTLFAMAVYVLREHHELGRLWPLSYTLPSGRSIEAVCDRVAHLNDTLPDEILGVLHQLLMALAIAEPATTRYADYAPVLREIVMRLTLPSDQRRPQSERLQ